MPSIDTITTSLTIFLACFGVALLLLWLAAAVYAYRDLRSRSRSAGKAWLAFFLVLLLPVLGLVIYLLLRPKETLMEAYDRALEQEALLQQIEEKSVCPGCSQATQPDWIICPHCDTVLRQPCANCGRPQEPHWHACPYCGYREVEEDGVAMTETAGVEEDDEAATE